MMDMGGIAAGKEQSPQSAAPTAPLAKGSQETAEDGGTPGETDSLYIGGDLCETCGHRKWVMYCGQDCDDKSDGYSAGPCVTCTWKHLLLGCRINSDRFSRDAVRNGRDFCFVVTRCEDYQAAGGTEKDSSSPTAPKNDTEESGTPGAGEVSLGWT